MIILIKLLKQNQMFLLQCYYKKEKEFDRLGVRAKDIPIKCINERIFA